MSQKHLTILAAPVTFAIGLAIGLTSLPAQQPKPVISSDAAAERIPNLGTLKTELKRYHDCTCKCGCYAHDLDAQADRAIEFLHRLDARHRRHEKLALILDIDDTTLSTYPEMVGADFGYDPASYDAWLATAQAPAIPGTLRIYKEAQKFGFNIFFITGRKEAVRAATERNLRAQGFDSWNLLVMLPADRGSANQGSQTIGAFKAVARRQIAAAGYTLALSVGDQWSDLKGKPEAEYSVKYPDPYYLIP
jgi:putative acid phosphatase of HAD superfamily subfamily IIIB